MTGWENDMATDELMRLIEIADCAYLQAREEIFDSLPAGTPLDRGTLTSRQCRLLDLVAAAEAEVASHRKAEHARCD
jgi:hypothetical protein